MIFFILAVLYRPCCGRYYHYEHNRRWRRSPERSGADGRGRGRGRSRDRSGSVMWSFARSSAQGAKAYGAPLSAAETTRGRSKHARRSDDNDNGPQIVPPVKLTASAPTLVESAGSSLLLPSSQGALTRNTKKTKGKGKGKVKVGKKAKESNKTSTAGVPTKKSSLKKKSSQKASPTTTAMTESVQADGRRRANTIGKPSFFGETASRPLRR